MTTQPDRLQHLSPEERQRQASGNTSAKGRKARTASPWNRGPMCDTANAGKSFQRYKKRGRA